jgi:hypothetical protein
MLTTTGSVIFNQTGSIGVPGKETSDKAVILTVVSYVLRYLFSARL